MGQRRRRSFTSSSRIVYQTSFLFFLRTRASPLFSVISVPCTSSKQLAKSASFFSWPTLFLCVCLGQHHGHKSTKIIEMVASKEGKKARSDNGGPLCFFDARCMPGPRNKEKKVSENNDKRECHVFIWMGEHKRDREKRTSCGRQQACKCWLRAKRSAATERAKKKQKGKRGARARPQGARSAASLAAPLAATDFG